MRNEGLEKIRMESPAAQLPHQSKYRCRRLDFREKRQGDDHLVDASTQETRLASRDKDRELWAQQPHIWMQTEANKILTDSFR